MFPPVQVSTPSLRLCRLCKFEYTFGSQGQKLRCVLKSVQHTELFVELGPSFGQRTYQNMGRKGIFFEVCQQKSGLRVVVAGAIALLRVSG